MIRRFRIYIDVTTAGSQSDERIMELLLRSLTPSIERVEKRGHITALGVERRKDEK